MQEKPVAVEFEHNEMKAGTALKKAPESITSIRNDGILTEATLADLYREVLLRIGEDPDRDGLKRTPERVEKAIQFLTRGYNENPTKLLRDALFDVDYDEMV